MPRATRKLLLLLAGAILTSIAFVACLGSVSPQSAINVTGTQHTITAEVPSGSVAQAVNQTRPQQTEVPWTIHFTVISGPNTGRTSDTLSDCQPSCQGSFDAFDETTTVTWTYTGTGGPGTDTI